MPEALLQDNAIDPRIVANAIVGYSSAIGQPVTNIALQKLLYFAHGVHLVRYRRPLVSGFFEAWHYGPVHPAVYSAFKENGRNHIRTKVGKTNLRTGEKEDLPDLADPVALRVVLQTVSSYGEMTPGQLVKLSHAPNGPWYEVFRSSQSGMVMGLRISNELILDRFRYHSISSDCLDDIGELNEDTPLTYHGFG